MKSSEAPLMARSLLMVTPTFLSRRIGVYAHESVLQEVAVVVAHDDAADLQAILIRAGFGSRAVAVRLDEGSEERYVARGCRRRVEGRDRQVPARRAKISASFKV